MTTDSVRNFVIIEVNRNERSPQCGAATIEVADKEDLTMNNSINKILESGKRMSGNLPSNLKKIERWVRILWRNKK